MLRVGCSALCDVSRAGTLSRDLLGAFILPEAHKAAMPQVPVLGPLHEFKLPDQFWFEPAALFHLGLGQPCAPASSLFLRQVDERAFLCLQGPEALDEFSP